MITEAVLSTSCKEIIVGSFDATRFREIFLVAENDLTQEAYLEIVSSFEEAERLHLLRSLITLIDRNAAYRRITASFFTLAIQRLIEAILIKEMNRLDSFLTLNNHPCTSYYFQFCREWDVKPVSGRSLALYVSGIEARFRGSILNVDVESYLAYLASGIPMENRLTSNDHSVVSYLSSLIKLSDKVHETPGGRENYYRYQEMIKAYIAQEGLMPILRHNFTILTHLEFDKRDLWKYFLRVSIDHETISDLYKNKKYKSSDVKNFKNWLLDLMRSQPALCTELKMLEIRNHDTQMRRFLEVGIKTGKVRVTSSLVEYCALVHNTAFSHERLFELMRSESAVQSHVFYQYLVNHLRGLNEEQLEKFLEDFNDNARESVTPPDIIANPAALLCYLLVAKHPAENRENDHFNRFISTVKEQLIYVNLNDYQRSQLVFLMRALPNDERKILKNSLLQMVETYRLDFMAGLESDIKDQGSMSAFITFMRMGRKTQVDTVSKSYDKLIKLIEQYKVPVNNPKKEKSRRHSAGDRNRMFVDSHSSSSGSASTDVSPVNSYHIKA